MMKGLIVLKTYIDAVSIEFYQSPNTYPIKIDIPEKCPCCETAYALKPETAVCYGSDEQITKAYCIFFCPTCEDCFFVSYDVIEDRDDMIGILCETFPFPQTKTVFSHGITSLSPDFVQIYQQSEQAENQNLHDICGMGYRKALEFLIKDFAIYSHPDKKSEIESPKLTLSHCIDNYIDSEKIKTLAKASSWIGNDETHYTRKHEDYNIQDMKRFINTTAAFIEYELNFAEASEFLNRE